MWTAKNRGRYDRSKLRYPSDLTDAEWALVEPLIPPARRGGKAKPLSQNALLLSSGLDGCANMYTSKHNPREDMSSTTVSVRIDPAIKKRLEQLAKSTGRSRSFLAAEAITEYLDLNDWQVAGIQKAVVSLGRGEGVSHERVKEWVNSWGSKSERPAPKRSAP